MNGARPLSQLCVFAACWQLVACSAAADDEQIWQQPVVYDSDDRREYFEVSSERHQALMEQSIVALVPNDLLRASDYDLSKAPRHGEAKGLCENEPFFTQPSAAFCTGVLVDWDLVLSAGHCARAFATRNFSVVFDFFYVAPDRLESTAHDRTK